MAQPLYFHSLTFLNQKGFPTRAQIGMTGAQPAVSVHNLGAGYHFPRQFPQLPVAGFGHRQAREYEGGFPQMTQLRQLIAKYIGGLASVPELMELAQLINDRPSAAAAFAKATRSHGILTQILRHNRTAGNARRQFADALSSCAPVDE
jgi:hypothetical protein